MYIPSFALPIYKTTCHAKPYLCYLYRNVQYRYLALYVCNLLLFLTTNKTTYVEVVGEMMKKRWSSGAPVHVLHGNWGTSYVYKIFFFIFRRMRYTDVCFLHSRAFFSAWIDYSTTKRKMKRTAGWSCSVFFSFLPTLLRKLHGDGCCTEPSEKFRLRPRYDYEKNMWVVTPKMCCCCCRRFCGGAPTTDERIHASVLHDAS